MAKKHFFTILLLLLFSPYVQSQIVSTGEGVFTKAFIENTPNGAVLKAEHEIVEGYQALYFDGENGIRKYISDYEYPESSFLTAASYDSSGKLMAILFKISVPEGSSCYGLASVTNNDDDNPLFNYNINYFSEAEEKWIALTNTDSPFPDFGEEFQISNYIDTNNLLKTINLKDISISDDFKKVRFRRPQVGDLAMLNTVLMGRMVWVLDIEKGEKTRYIVELKGDRGLVDSIYLEDVEEEVEH